MLFPIEIPESERTPLVNWLLNLVAEQKLVVKNQQQVIENQKDTIAELERKVEQLEKQVNGLDEELKAIKKLKSKPKISPSKLNQEKKTPREGEKRAGSEKRSKKTSFVPDEERLIEPDELPDGATFNGCIKSPFIGNRSKSFRWVCRGPSISTPMIREPDIKEKMGFAPSSATTCLPTSAVATARVEPTICGC